MCVCVCFRQSKANKKPDIDVLAVCKIVSEEDDRETDVHPVGCDMDPTDDHAVFRRPSQLLHFQLPCDIAWTAQLLFHIWSVGDLHSQVTKVLDTSCQMETSSKHVSVLMTWPGWRSVYSRALVLDGFFTGTQG